MRDFRGPRGREESPMKRSTNRKRHRPEEVFAELRRVRSQIAATSLTPTHHPRLPRPAPLRRSDFGRSDSVAYEFVQFGRGNREPETFRGARSLDARRDNPRARPRRSASASANPLRWPTPRDLRARNPLSQNAVRTPQNANAPAVGPGRSLLTVGRASFARAF